MRIVIIHELRMMFRDRTLVMLGLVLACCTLWGLRTGTAAVDTRASLADEASRDEARVFAGFERQVRPSNALETGSSGFDPASNPAVLALFYPRIAVLPPAPLAELSLGQSDVYPPYFRVTAERQDSFLDATEPTNPLHLMTGGFDLAFVVVYILPLFLLLLTHDVLAGEREGGTLPHVMAQPIDLRAVMFGKLIARAYPIVVLVAVTALVLAATGRLGATTTWMSFGMWTALVVAYGAFWLAIGAAVDRLGRSPATNAGVLAGLWLALVVIGPAAAHIAVSRMAPVPPRTELVIATRDAETRSRRPVELLDAYYREHPNRYPSHPEFDLGVYDFPLYWFAIQREVDRLMRPVLARYDASLDDRRRATALVQLLLPAVLAQETLNDIAGTGLARSRPFFDQVDAFHKRHIAFFEPLIVSKTSLSSDDYAHMPRFTFEEEPPGAVAWRAGAGIAVLLAITMVLIALVGRPMRGIGPG